MSPSLVRADRIGPIAGTWSHWKTANSLVRPPSTVSSTTRSAWSRPAWGRASETLSILTASAGRPAHCSSVGGFPVRGQVLTAIGSGLAVGDAEGLVGEGDA